MDALSLAGLLFVAAILSLALTRATVRHFPPLLVFFPFVFGPLVGTSVGCALLAAAAPTCLAVIGAGLAGFGGYALGRYVSQFWFFLLLFEKPKKK